MNITTRFNIGNLVKPKFEKHGKEKLYALEVLEIEVGVCMAGPQMFYKCRGLIAKFERENPYDRELQKEWTIAHTQSANGGNIGWEKYREDELLPLTDEELEIFKHN